MAAKKTMVHRRQFLKIYSLKLKKQMILNIKWLRKRASCDINRETFLGIGIEFKGVK